MKKTRKIVVLGLAMMFAVTLAGEAMARGGNGGGGNGGGAGSGVRSQGQSSSQTTTASRPADTQRHDGTFLSTGTTASGATTRPGNGKGVQDGSGLTTTTTPVASAVTE